MLNARADRRPCRFQCGPGPARLCARDGVPREGLPQNANKRCIARQIDNITPACKLLISPFGVRLARRRAAMSITLPDARHLSDEALQSLRLRALRGIELGYSEVELADVLGVCHETISRWWSAYSAAGTSALPGDRTGRPLGGGRLLSDAQSQRIRQRIDNDFPSAFGIAPPLWTRRAVRELLQQEFCITLPERTVGQSLCRSGYTPKN